VTVTYTTHIQRLHETEQDAERYRWLRTRLIQGITVHYDEALGRELIDILSAVSGKQFDAAVDTAMASSDGDKGE
jgi:hypothetical protein